MPNRQTISACTFLRTEEKRMSDNRWSGVHGKNSGLDGDETSTGQYVMAEAGLVSERKTKAVSVTERPPAQNADNLE